MNHRPVVGIMPGEANSPMPCNDYLAIQSDNVIEGMQNSNQSVIIWPLSMHYEIVTIVTCLFTSRGSLDDFVASDARDTDD